MSELTNWKVSCPQKFSLQRTIPVLDDALRVFETYSLCVMGLLHGKPSSSSRGIRGRRPNTISYGDIPIVTHVDDLVQNKVLLHAVHVSS